MPASTLLLAREGMGPWLPAFACFPRKLVQTTGTVASVFMNETVRDYCQQVGIEFTRCRPYGKNDQPLLVRLAEYVPPPIWDAP
jgi:hypothetical protein